MIKYTIGDATFPNGEGTTKDRKIIIHCCNNKKGWGRGFVLAINKRSMEPRRVFVEEMSQELGEYKLVPISSDTNICNIVGQNGYGAEKKQYVVYDALDRAFTRLAEEILSSNIPTTIHAPRLGAGLAGGDWNVIESMLINRFINQGINVTIYDLPS